MPWQLSRNLIGDSLSGRVYKQVKLSLISLTASWLLFSSPASVQPVPRSEDPIIKIDGQPIPYEQFAWLASQIDSPPKTKKEEKKLKDEIINELLTQFLIELEASRINVLDDSVFRQRFEDQLFQAALQELAELVVYSQIVVADSEVQNYYTAHSKDFYLPDRVRASHILITPVKDSARVEKQKKERGIYPLTDSAAAALADTIYHWLKKGSSFDSLARIFSDDRISGEKGGELNYFSREQMVAPFATEAFRLSVGAYSKPVKTQFGYHLIKVTDRLPAGQQPLNDSLIEAIKTHKLRPPKIQARATAYVDSLKKIARVTYNEPWLVTPPDSVKDKNDWVMTINATDTIRFPEFNLISESARRSRNQDSLSLSEKKDLLMTLAQKYLLKQATRTLGCYDAPHITKMRTDLIKTEQERRIKKVYNDDYQPSQSELVAYYDAHRADYQEPMPLHVYHIIFSDSAQAAAVRDSIVSGGKDFAEMAKRYYPGDKELREVAYNLDYIGPDAMPKSFYAAALTLEIGQVSQPVLTEWGYHLIKLIDKKPAPTLKSVTPRIEVILRAAYQKKLHLQWLSQLKQGHKIWINKKLLRSFTFEQTPATEPVSPASGGQ